MAKGFEEGIRMMKEGATGRVYIPSMLAYGAQPPSPDIKPFEHLMFDIKVLSVKDAPTTPQGMPPGVDPSQMPR